ncbi:MAG: hypothetical protein JNK66_02480 [Chitinophagales bacterium]|nr:hypothetical protein [Chitinophagales bacterium]
MKTITIRCSSDEDANLLKQILETTDFESVVEVEEETADEVLSEIDLRMLNERVAEYHKNPSTGKSIEQVSVLLKNKYGL